MKNKKTLWFLVSMIFAISAIAEESVAPSMSDDLPFEATIMQLPNGAECVVIWAEPVGMSVPALDMECVWRNPKSSNPKPDPNKLWDV